ncbi:MAG TPA: hypothetical protein ENH45_02730 [Nitrospirae bacterium]|nr:hypothetical protein BMS3Bbin09_00176 [bacterium BMS3Bbin09]HDZ84109.1 hypothetical protein [Nitrospirota bacterium]
MKYMYMIVLLAATLICSNAFAVDAPAEKPATAHEQELLMDCNLAARNSLINGNIAKVEKTCMLAAEKLEKSHPDKGYMINPMLNLAFTYSLRGDYAKAEPIIARAKELGEKFYKPGSSEIKSLNNFIEDNEKRKSNPPQFDKSSVTSPH